MRKAALAGLFLCAFIFAGSNQPASAEALEYFDIDNSANYGIEIAALEAVKSGPEDNTELGHEETHMVKTGETLISISKSYGVDWKRIYYKNTQIQNPDIISVGDTLVIPSDEENLKPRTLAAVETTVTSANDRVNTKASRVSYAPKGSSAGNRYGYGYCTWYVKNRRPDLPNNLGNANTWVARARAQGLPTGSKPRVGAVGQQGMHVVYVEAIHSNGTVTISEMNFAGWNVVNRRTVPASNFQYIY